MRFFRRGLAFALFLSAVAALVALLVLPAEVAARPGGGQSYSGGGSSSGGGSGGGGGDAGCIWVIVQIWFRFVFRYPVIGIPLTILIIIALLRWNKGRETKSWDSAPGLRTVAPPAARTVQDLDAIRELDPQFSVVLFEDFVYALYAKAHGARHDPQALAALAPYLSAGTRDQLARRVPVGVPVSNVVVGAMRVQHVLVPTVRAPQTPQAVGANPAVPPPPPGPSPQLPQVVVLLEFEANLTLGDRDTQYLVERWRLVRDAGVLTRASELARSFHCPNCGAPASAQGGDRCEYCGQVVGGGHFDWNVAGIDSFRVEGRELALGGTSQEVGTDWPTVFHPALAARRAELLRDDPAATDEAIAARLGLIYTEFNAAWTALDLRPVRPFVSDGLYDYLQYWIDAYRRQGLRNVLQGMRLTNITLAKVVRDRHFDALTFRIWAAGRDWTIRQDSGAVIGGNPNADRAYSEYWTLIRGAATRGRPRTEKSCPHCGASLEVNMAGRCEHCNAKITSGDFDWVLSKIEQDDSYSG
jgi:hypothetical protein